MPDFMDEAKNLAGEHAELVDKGLDEVEQEAESKTGGRFDSEIQGAEQQAEGFLGVDQQGRTAGPAELAGTREDLSRVRGAVDAAPRHVSSLRSCPRPGHPARCA